MKSPLLCRMGLHKLNKYMYVQVTRRRSNRHGGKYHTNYAICERCGKVAPVDEKLSTPNWTVYRTKEPCECGGKYTARAFLEDKEADHA